MKSSSLFFSVILVYVSTILFLPPVTSSQENFSQRNAIKILYHISEVIGPRPMGSPAEQDALKYGVEKFLDYGCDTAYVMPMNRTSIYNTNSGIAIGIIRGTSKRIIVIGGHIDTVNPEVRGTDDDGSGSACVIELARVFAQREMTSTLVFCLFGGEEQGLQGSQYFVDNFENINDVAMMLQIDMANGLGVIDIDGDTYGKSAPEWLIRAVSEEFYSLGYSGLRYPTHFFAINYTFRSGAGSDHEPFLQKGIPAIDLTSDVSNPIHTPLDNWKNFDQRGLERSGMVMQKIVERFDNGAPNAKPTNYWLYKLGTRLYFLPLPVLWGFLVFTFLLSIAAYFYLWGKSRSETSSDSFQPKKKYRVPTLKLLALALLLAIVSWFLPDVLVLITGTRYPWFAQPLPYIILMMITFLLTVWAALQITPKISFSVSPLPYYRACAIFLFLFILLAVRGNVKLSMYPAVFLCMLSLSVFIKNGAIKLVLIGIGFWFSGRIIYSEWFEFVARNFAFSGETINEFPTIASYNIFAIGILTAVVFPVVSSLAILYRSHHAIQFLVEKYRTKPIGIALMIILLTSLTVAAMNLSYTDKLARRVKIEQHFDLADNTQSVLVKSGDYLSNTRITFQGKDTILEKRNLVAHLPIRDSLATPWVTIERTKVINKIGDTTNFLLSLHISSLKKPYVVEIGFDAGGKEFLNVETPYHHTTSKKGLSISFFSFPDSQLTIPLAFQIIGQDSVEESSMITFSELPLPLRARREKTFFIPRAYFSETVKHRPE
ncbi:MAG: Zn-dependent exopeptidase M28 [Ignavibacteriales bacterium]|nr:Zn-dependent exopeptidase M28 [Ignavibacteriales bacterium]